eukprot:TRINITY_DN885_c0_g1_i1.p1 TRINITY_DN885_c0_g1~~TRINITY_DN885_c0_g1_i1.p1  ORF type:complete len:337 (+),score=100.78 TRINITY_DN885_c0_g1_i1:35-1012(+)
MRRELSEIELSTIPKDSIYPESLDDFNYERNQEGYLRIKGTNEKFKYITERHYEALGDVIYKDIQNKMKTEFDLDEVKLPIGVQNEAFNNIFLSKDALTCEKLLLIIQGSGAVRAGQWARALCLNETLEVGSILPYLKRAKEAGYGVIVFNPNLNQTFIEKERDPPKEKTVLDYFLNPEKPVTRRGKLVPIEGNEDPHKHTLYVWDNFVKKAAAKKISIVAHSAGGSCTLHLLRKRTTEVLEKLCAVAFTDAVHSVSPNEDKSIKTFLENHAINWVASLDKLDTPQKLKFNNSGCPLVSAGHEKHEWTSGMCITSVFTFLEKHFN